MLAYEEARERLRAHRSGEDGEAVRRRIGPLPRRAANVGALLLGDALEGEEPGWEHLESLSRRRRRALFDAIVPTLGSHLERMWQDGVGRPYQVGWERRAFRAPRAPAASAPRRFDEVGSVARRLGDYEVPDAAWLARWAPHLGYQPAEIGLLLAAVIDGGGRDGDDVLDVLYASAEGEEEVGGMGRHVTTALLACDRPDAWEAVVLLLLAAQRQEGLRQVILEAADEARPEAFGLLLDTILEHGLVRFSATARAAGVWLGLEQWAGDERRLQDLLERTAELQRDPDARAQALDGPPAEAYLALAATAWTDAYEALPQAERLLADRDPERRFAAIHLLGQLRVPEAAAPLVVALGDPDLRVAALAFQGVTVHRHGPEDTFDRLEAFLRRLDANKVEIEPAVWPGTGGTLERSRVAHELLLWGHAHPPMRLVVLLDALDPYGRSAVLTRIQGAGASDPELRGHVLALLGDASPQVRETAVSAARTLTLAEDEVQEVEALLSRKAGDLRRGVVALLLAQPDDAVLASADRLLAEGRAPLRLGGLELLRQLVEDDRAVADARRRGREYAEHHLELAAEETVQLDILLGRRRRHRPRSTTASGSSIPGSSPLPSSRAGTTCSSCPRLRSPCCATSTRSSTSIATPSSSSRAGAARRTGSPSVRSGGGQAWPARAAGPCRRRFPRYGSAGTPSGPRAPATPTGSSSCARCSRPRRRPRAATAISRRAGSPTAPSGASSPAASSSPSWPIAG